MKIPKVMSAAVLHGKGDLRLEEAPVPSPGPDEVLIRVMRNGLCGSDIHFYEDGRLGPFVVSEPYIPGHEAAGVVVGAAASGNGPKVGERVAIEPGIPCRRCAWCKAGRYNLCPEVVFLSAPPTNGTFAGYAAVAADFAHPIPEHLGDEEAAFAEPVSVGVQACARAGLRPGATVAILGGGPIGLVTFLVARAYGAGPAYLFDLIEGRLELARQLGVDAAIDASAGDPARALMERTGGRGADVVFDTSGSSAACAAAPHMAARGGVIAQVGWPEKGVVPYPVEVVLEKELDVRGVNRYANTFPLAIALLAGGRCDVRPLISHRFPFERVCEAFRFGSANRTSAVKIMVGAA